MGRVWSICTVPVWFKKSILIWINNGHDDSRVAKINFSSVEMYMDTKYAQESGISSRNRQSAIMKYRNREAIDERVGTRHNEGG